MAGPAMPGAGAATPTQQQPVAGPMFGGAGAAGFAGTVPPTGAPSMEQPPLDGGPGEGVGIVASDDSVAQRIKQGSPVMLVAALTIAVLVVGLGGAYALGLFDGEDREQVAEIGGKDSQEGNSTDANSRIITPEDGTVRINFPSPGVNRPGDDEPSASPPPDIDPVDPPEPDPRPMPRPEPRPQPTPEPDPIPIPEPMPLPDPMPDPMPELTPAQVEQVNRHLAQAKQALGRREFAAADTAISEAEQLATSGQPLEKTQRLRELHRYVVEYWDAVEQSLLDLEGKELVLNNTRALVIAADANGMTMRYQGRNLTFTKETMPASLVRLIADRWFTKGDPQNKVFIGAFLAVDPEGDPAEARRLWQEAIAARVPVRNLMPVLDDEY